jgi:hypothetical protein
MFKMPAPFDALPDHHFPARQPILFTIVFPTSLNFSAARACFLPQLKQPQSRVWSKFSPILLRLRKTFSQLNRFVLVK